MGIVAGEAPLPFLHGLVNHLFPFSGILMAFKAKFRNRFGNLHGTFRKMVVVAHSTILISHRFMNEPVLEEGFMAVLAAGRRSQEQHGQRDEHYQDVKSRTTHPDMLITTGFRCQQGRISGLECRPEIQCLVSGFWCLETALFV